VRRVEWSGVASGENAGCLGGYLYIGALCARHSIYLIETLIRTLCGFYLENKHNWTARKSYFSTKPHAVLDIAEHSHVD
jgi:hypothetical protein